MEIKYTLKDDSILKDGHTMMLDDVIKDLNRKSYLETVICPVYMEPIRDCEISEKRQKELYKP